MPCMLNEDRTLKLSLRGNQKASYRVIKHKLLQDFLTDGHKTEAFIRYLHYLYLMGMVSLYPAYVSLSSLI